MKTFYLQLFITVLLLSATACTQNFALKKQNYIENYQAWIIDLQNNYVNLNEADWKTVESDFDQYSKTEFDRFRSEFTPEEKEKIEMLSGQFYTIKGKYEALQLKEKLNNLLDQANGMVEEFNR